MIQQVGKTTNKGKSVAICICPFPDHNETVGSMNICEADHWYHCFGCRRHGRSEDLINRFGSVMFSGKSGGVQRVKRYTEEETNLEDTGLEYLKMRGFTDETIKAFDVFHNKITKRIDIPIMDESGYTYGIIGRTTVGEEPKYR